MPTRAIKAIFFTRFHHEKGSRVLHQVPEGSITPSSSPSALRAPLFSFDSVTSYLIPTQQFCDRLLSFCVNHYRVIGYPVCIREGKYSRNEFIFNWALVIEEGLGDWVAIGEVVRKVGRLLRGLEEQGGFVSTEEDLMGVWEDEGDGGMRGWRGGGGSKVFAMCEMLLEDLNNYAECMIPIDDSNTINLKLFPTRPPPPPIHAHQVPILTINLSSLSTPISSDLTLTRILSYINGINSVSQIAQLADTDLSLTRKAIQHLVYYGCLVLIDVFSFGAVYAPSAEIGGFITDEAVRDECVRYVQVPRVRWGSTAHMGSESSLSAHDSRSSISSNASTTSTHSDTLDSLALPGPAVSEDVPHVSHETLITLYTSLRQGLPLRAWVLENLSLLHGIDIRRLITFGVIKGFLYRIHKYAIATSTASSLPPAPPTSLQSGPASTAPSTPHAHSDTSTIRNHNHPQQHHHHHHPSLSHTHHHSQSHLQHKPPLASPLFTSSTATTIMGSSNSDGRRSSALENLAAHAHGYAANEAPSDADADATTAPGDMATATGTTTATATVTTEPVIGSAADILRFLDGMHCFDEMCTELRETEKMVERRVRGVGEVVVFSR